MAQLVAKITVEDLPLYKDMAEFIVTIATTDDDVPASLRERALYLAQRIQAMLEKRSEQ